MPGGSSLPANGVTSLCRPDNNDQHDDSGSEYINDDTTISSGYQSSSSSPTATSATPTVEIRLIDDSKQRQNSRDNAATAQLSNTNTTVNNTAHPLAIAGNTTNNHHEGDLMVLSVDGTDDPNAWTSISSTGTSLRNAAASSATANNIINGNPAVNRQGFNQFDNLTMANQRPTTKGSMIMGGNQQPQPQPHHHHHEQPQQTLSGAGTLIASYHTANDLSSPTLSSMNNPIAGRRLPPSADRQAAAGNYLPVQSQSNASSMSTAALSNTTASVLSTPSANRTQQQQQQQQQQQHQTPFISFTQQKLFLQRQQVLSDQQPAIQPTASIFENNSALVSKASSPSSQQHPLASHTNNNSSNNQSAPLNSTASSLIIPLNSQEWRRNLRELSRKADRDMQGWWALGVDPMQASLQRVLKRLSADNNTL
jgi:hypothetical protein